MATTNLKLAFSSKKLAPKFLVPFPVRRKIDDVSYEWTLPVSLKINSVLHVSLLKLAASVSWLEKSGPPVSVIINGDEELEVKAIGHSGLQKKGPDPILD